MIDLHIIGQTIRHSSPNIAADSYKYLEVQCWFAGTEWNSLFKWLHFKQGDTEYTLELNENNQITAEQGLNLTVGEWEIFLTGSGVDERITTIPIIVNVYESGLINAPLGAMPMTVAEQVAVKADTALSMAQSVLSAAENGEFDGKSFEIVDYFETLADLEAAITEPQAGVLYGVGTTPPLDVYGWSPTQKAWINNGTIQGAQGEAGKQGVTFTPAVDSSGNLSWSNDGGLANPGTVNIRGPQGAQGEAGEDGKGPYEFALDAGYTGTAETLASALIMAPQHHTRHEAGGIDQINVTAPMIPDKAITRAKLANDALYSPITYVSSSEVYLNTAHNGCTFEGGYDTDFDVIITQQNSASIPLGAEMALFMWGRRSTIRVVPEGVRLVNAGATDFYKDKSFKIADSFGMIAIKKVSANATSGDAWLVTGNVEVVS